MLLLHSRVIRTAVTLLSTSLAVGFPLHRCASLSSKSVLFVRKHRSLSLAMSTASTSSSSKNNPMEDLGLPTPLLLGSASFTRKLILKEMGIDFTKLVRPIDEKGLGDRSKDAPADLVMTLGQAKMQHLVQEIQAGRCDDDLPTTATNDGDDDKYNFVVLTGDQVVTCNGQILEKPESIDEARKFVASYAQHPPSTVGSCVLTHVASGISVAGVDTATIHFADNIPASLIDELEAKDEPVLSCAGGLMVEHPLTKQYIARIDGTEDSVMGLSKDLVLRLLKELADKLAENKKATSS